MFSNDVDHSLYLIKDLEALEKMPGYPFSRFINIGVPPAQATIEDDERLIMALHGSSGELLLVTTKKIVVYKIPQPKSFLKKAFGVAVDFVPGVSDVVGGIGDLKSGAGNLKTFAGWVSGKNKRLTKERKAAGMPSKKHFKDVTWQLKKPEIKALVLAYRDDILIANGFGWKTKFENAHDIATPTKLILKKYAIDIHSGNSKWYFSLSTKDDNAHAVLKAHRHVFSKTLAMVVQIEE